MTDRTVDYFFERSIPEPNSGCWLWLGAVDRRGYGAATVLHKKKAAHRGAYEAAYGPIPAGLAICHRCDQPGCVNPEHLFAGTARDNRQDMYAKGRVPRGSQHSMSKLSEGLVAAIRHDRRPAAVISAEIGVNASTVQRARIGKTWTHVRAEEAHRT